MQCMCSLEHMYQMAETMLFVMLHMCMYMYMHQADIDLHVHVCVLGYFSLSTMDSVSESVLANSDAVAIEGYGAANASILWVDKYAPRHYTHLLSDDVSNFLVHVCIAVFSAACSQYQYLSELFLCSAYIIQISSVHA